MPPRTRTAAKSTPAAPAAPAAPAGPTAGSTAPSLSFGDAEVPERTRASVVVNPVLDVCRAIQDTLPADGDRSTIAKTVTVATDKQVAQVKRWLGDASKELGVTFRSVPQYNAETGEYVVTFWAVKKIQHSGRRGNGNGNGAGTK